MKIKKEYIKSLIKRKSLKQKEVALKIGVSSQDWNNWMFRGVFPHYDKLQKLATLLDVEAADLIIESVFNEPNHIYKNGTSLPLTESIPFYDISVQSALSILSDHNSDSTPNDYIYIPGLSADFIFVYYGKEMEPILSNGDLIALRRITDSSFFNYGNIYLISTKEQVIIRYIKSSEKSDHIILSAHDEKSDDIEIPIKKLKSVYAVVTTIKRQII